MKPSLLASVVIVLSTLHARAGTLGDLKASVARLTAHEPARATFATDSSVKASGKFANETSARTITADVSHDAHGITITIPQALLDKAAHDETARNAISAIRPIDIVDALDYRESLLTMLRNASTAEETRVVFRGKTARMLVMNLTMPRENKKNSIVIGSVKVAEDRLTVWVGDDNLPLAAERTEKKSAGFLMFHADTTNRTLFTFGQAGDRLILTRRETSGSGSALGQKIDEASVQTMTLR